jgi:hypothetical protein
MEGAASVMGGLAQAVEPLGERGGGLGGLHIGLGFPHCGKGVEDLKESTQGWDPWAGETLARRKVYRGTGDQVISSRATG